MSPTDYVQINIVTAGGVITYIVMCITYLRFYYATKAQGFDRNRLPYTGYFQPVSSSMSDMRRGRLLTLESVVLRLDWPRLDDLYRVHIRIQLVPTLLGVQLLHLLRPADPGSYQLRCLEACEENEDRSVERGGSDLGGTRH